MIIDDNYKTINEIKDNLIKHFDKVYGNSENVKVYFAPGRVNLIGEYTDYNGGHVLPCSLSIGTYCAVKLRDDSQVRLKSLNFCDTDIIHVDLKELQYKEEHDWANYPKGMIKTLMDNGYSIPNGFDILFYGNIPNGAGLSSSASIEVLTGYVLKDMFGFEFDMVQLAVYGRMAENQYIGVNCGIMDQFAVAMGQANNAIFLNTSTLNYSYVPLELGSYKILIMNTNKRRGLKDSKYNERRKECEEALKLIRREYEKQCIKIDDLNDLCSITMDEWENVKISIVDEILYKRAQHVITENERTIEAIKVLEQGDLISFGKLMTASHMSLKNDYEVTGIELDTLVETALRCKGVLGARMTGAGFGGCAIALVEEGYIEEVVSEVGKSYNEKTGLLADFVVVEIGNGPCKIKALR